MTREEIRFINQFQATIVVPIQKVLTSQKHESYKNEDLFRTIREIICSLSVLPESNGEFKLTYLCRGHLVSSFYTLDGTTEQVKRSLEHVEHSLWEVLKYLKIYSSIDGLSCNEFSDLVQGIEKLLKIISPEANGKLIP